MKSVPGRPRRLLLETILGAGLHAVLVVDRRHAHNAGWQGWSDHGHARHTGRTCMLCPSARCQAPPDHPPADEAGGPVGEAFGPASGTTTSVEDGPVGGADEAG